MKKFLFLLPMLYIQISLGQIEDALVFFSDKENVQTSINNPISILTQEALDRKAMHNVVIDERDVPVNENYIAQVKAQSGITVWAKSKWLNCVYVQGTESNVQGLLALPFVTSIEWADKDKNLPTPDFSTKNKLDLQETESRITYNYGAATNQVEMIAADFLHEEDFTGEGMVIAMMDSGFPDFQTNPAFSHVVSNGRLLGTYDFFSRTSNVTGTGSHGIVTVSDIAAFLDNQFVGTAPNASFYLFRTEYGPDENPREEAWWVEALERADSLGVDVVNTSLGYQDYDNPNYDHSYEDLDGQTTIAARGANIAFEKGMLLVTSGGNDGNGFGTVGTPADAIGILSIGAVDSNGDYASFSSRGPTVDGRVKPDVMAQGQSAAYVNSSGNVDFASGTSLSSPIIAGAVACLWQSRPGTPNGQIMQIIRESAHLFNNPTNEMGYGIPNFQDAYIALQQLSIQDQLLQENFAIYPNPVVDVITISFPDTLSTANLELYNVLGVKVLQQRIAATNPKLDVSNLNSGVYILTISSEGVTNSFKVIKQ